MAGYHLVIASYLARSACPCVNTFALHFEYLRCYLTLNMYLSNHLVQFQQPEALVQTAMMCVKRY